MTEVEPLTVYCADIGSGNKFGWAFGRPGGPASPGGSRIEDLAERVVRDLEAGIPVALGFECPLFVPVPGEAGRLGRARVGEGNRSWSAAAGAAALATGLVQVAWLLEAVRRRLSHPVPGTLRWDCFSSGQPGLLLWEAFVSGPTKTESHVGDAQRAVELFLAAWPDLGRANLVTEAGVLSLAGAALLRSGWTEDVTMLSTPCLVVGARPEPARPTEPDEAPVRPVGRWNSMRTRVGPVFGALMARDSTGRTWLPQLVALATGESRRAEVSSLTGPILEARFGETERPLAPSRALLRWLVEHPDQLKNAKDPSRQPPKRRALLAGSARERDEARRLLAAERLPERAWYILEGSSYPDVFLRTPTGIVVIEGKRTEPDVTTETTWMPERHQMLRHLDGAWDLRDDHRVVGLFIVEGEGGRDGTAVPDRWRDRCAATVGREALERSLPHRSAPEQAAIAAGYLGVTTWQAVCAALDVPYDRLPDQR